MSVFESDPIESLQELNLSFQVTSDLIEDIRDMHYNEGYDKAKIDETLSIDTGEQNFLLKVLGYPDWDTYNKNYALLLQKMNLGGTMSTLLEGLQAILSEELLPGLENQLSKLTDNLEGITNKLSKIEEGLEDLEAKDDFFGENMKKISKLFKKEEE